MDKTVSQIIIDFLEEKGVYDLYGREPNKLTYSDVIELESKLQGSLEFVDDEENKQKLEDLEDERDMAKSESEDYFDRLNGASEALSELINDLSDSEYLAHSGLVRKLEDIKNDLEL